MRVEFNSNFEIRLLTITKLNFFYQLSIIEKLKPSKYGLTFDENSNTFKF